MKSRYTGAELRYAATSRCTCGAGLAYPLDHADAQELSAWVCSRVLLGEVEMPAGAPSAPSGFFAPVERPDVAGVVHQGFSFVSYEIKSEAQPSVRGATTRPAGEAVAALAPPVAAAPHGLDFGTAIALMRRGARVQRAGWNGKGMWLRYVDLYNDKEFALRENSCARGTWLPFLAMKTVDNGLVPWLASQTDMLATDWSALDEGTP